MFSEQTKRADHFMGEGGMYVLSFLHSPGGNGDNIQR